MDRILEYLDELYPNPRCELNYKKDYELLIAVMLSAQTTDKRVNIVTKELFSRYSSLDELACASIEDLKNIIKPIGTYNIKANNIKNIAIALKNINSVPNDRDFLESLPGVGHKTANVVLSNLYNVPCFGVDTHVSRVVKRLGLCLLTDDSFQIEKKINAIVSPQRLGRLHHQLVLFGRYQCKALKPNCTNCGLQSQCYKDQLKTKF